jgi:hypothetical protein
MKPREHELLPEAELFELFRPRQPDRAAFRAGIERRVREREQGASEDRPERPSLVLQATRRAAALLQFDPSAAGSGPAVAKFLSAALLVPLLVVGLMVTAFTVGASALLRSARSARPAAEEPSSSAPGPLSSPSLALGTGSLHLLQFFGLALLFLPVVLRAQWTIDLLSMAFLVAGAGLVLCVRGFAELALLTQRSVARLAAGLLSALFCGVFLWLSPMKLPDGASELGLGWSGLVVLAGMVLCAALARPRAWLFALLLAWTAFVVGTLNSLGVTHASARHLAGWLTEIELDATVIRGWEQAARVHSALRDVGATPPPLPAAERELERTLLGEAQAHAHVWTAAQRMGLVQAEHWRRLSVQPMEAYALEQLLAQPGPLYMQSYHEYRLPMLLATFALTAEQREFLARRIDASWPAPGSFDPLRQALLCVRLLEHLGLTERLATRAADVRALLVSHWVHERRGPFDVAGGFTSDPRQLWTSLDGPSADAVELMLRFGVPDEIDLRLVRGYLRCESRAFPLVGERLAVLRAPARASLLRVEECLPLAPRSALEHVLGERMLIAALLLVSLCLLAIRSAPRPTGRGALP